jgi:GNAT superfamily N-acetyltransferase
MLALFVDKAYRTKGLGGKLVQRLEDWARERGIEKIYVQSVETTTSVGFYQSVGYRIACLMDASMMWLPGIETSIILVKRL